MPTPMISQALALSGGVSESFRKAIATPMTTNAAQLIHSAILKESGLFLYSVDICPFLVGSVSETERFSISSQHYHYTINIIK